MMVTIPIWGVILLFIVAAIAEFVVGAVLSGE